jgi:hypothetical protein
VAAHRCRATGWRVAVIQPFGGTCALRGCDPKKVLIAFKRSCTAPVPQQHEEAFKADFDPSGGLVGHRGLLGRDVKKFSIQRNLLPDTAIYLTRLYRPKASAGAPPTAVAQRITKEGGAYVLQDFTDNDHICGLHRLGGCNIRAIACGSKRAHQITLFARIHSGR